jgi:hypoxanthine phosphoribosyltransferase/bifunctional protein TilS/HprT
LFYSLAGCLLNNHQLYLLKVYHDSFLIFLDLAYNFNVDACQFEASGQPRRKGMKSTLIHPDFESMLVSEKDIQDICQKLGDQISKDYAGKTPLILAVLKGVVPFLTDLSKHFKFYCDYEFVASSSYHGGVVTSNWVEIYLWPRLSLKNKDVIIVEDIVDSGLTIQKIKQKAVSEGAKSVKVVTFLDKPEGRKVKFVPDYIGKSIPKLFVVGYGLDFDEKYRNVPYVGILKPSIIKMNPKDYPWRKGE